MTVFADTTEECRDLYGRILHLLHGGTTRFRKDKLFREIKENIDEYASGCNQDVARFFYIILDHLHQKVTIPATIRKLDTLIGESASDLATYYALTLKAGISLLTESFVENGRHREAALRLARQHGWTELCLRTNTNWAFMALEKGQLTVAREKTDEARLLIATMDKKLMGGDLAFEALSSRLKAHEARITIREAIESNSVEDGANRAYELYEAAYRQVIEDDHLRTNCTIEWADEFQQIADIDYNIGLQRAEDALELAARSLDTHICDFCSGYYHRVKGNLIATQAREAAILSPTSAINLLKAARQQLETSFECFSKTEHPQAATTKKALERVSSQEAILMRPDMVFLSHRSADKSLVRRFASALDTIGYRTWLDEKAMTAGVVLHRGLLDGMKNSAAAIFFITPDFADEGYLAKEIEYALQQEQERPGEFKIVPIVFRDAAGKTGTVPDLLRTYVYKHPENELEALEEIIRAVPLTIPPPRWT